MAGSAWRDQNHQCVAHLCLLSVKWTDRRWAC